MDNESTQAEEPLPSGSDRATDQAAEFAPLQAATDTAVIKTAVPAARPEQALAPGWDATPTPRYLPALPPPARGRLGRGARAGIVVALTLSGMALLINTLMLAGAWRVRNAAAAGLDDAIAQLAVVCDASAPPIVFPISQTIHFESDIALPNDLVIPFKGSIPINTIVRITVAGLPGSPTLEVPINTTVPVDTRVPVPGGISIPVNLDVPINQRIPVDLCSGEGPVRAMLERTISNVKNVRASLDFP